jgi:hypothetical protein
MAFYSTLLLRFVQLYNSTLCCFDSAGIMILLVTIRTDYNLTQLRCHDSHTINNHYVSQCFDSPGVDYDSALATIDTALRSARHYDSTLVTISMALRFDRCRESHGLRSDSVLLRFAELYEWFRFALFRFAWYYDDSTLVTIRLALRFGSCYD